MPGWQRSQASKSCWLTRWKSSPGAVKVLAGFHDAGQVQPAAFHDSAIRTQREHAVDDHMVGDQVEEHRGLDGDREVATVLIISDARQQVHARRTVEGEAPDVFAEPGTVPHKKLGGQARRQTREAPR